MKRPRICRSAIATVAAMTLAGSAAVAQQKVPESAAIGVDERAPDRQYLVGVDGRPVYVFAPDRKRRTTCYGPCERAWPPVLTQDDPRALSPLLAADALGTITRRDGTKQVTYAGWPLYYYARDTRTSVPSGHEVRAFGGEWFLLAPDGSIVRRDNRSHEPPRDPATEGTLYAYRR